MLHNINFVKWTTILLPISFLIVFFVLPITTVFSLSLSEKSGIVDVVFTGTLDNYLRIFNPLYGKIFLNTFIMTAWATFACFVIGFILALCVVFAKSEKMQNILLFIIILPSWINMLIRTYALIAILRTKGLINLSAQALWEKTRQITEYLNIAHWGIIGDKWVPFELLYNDFAVIVGLVYTYVPFMVLPIYASLNKIDKSCLEASYDMGAGHFTTITRVVIPMIKFGVFSGVLITFIPMLGSFLIPALLGGKDSIMISNVIAEQFTTINDYPFGSAMSSLLIYIVFALILIKYYYESKTKKAKQNYVKI